MEFPGTLAVGLTNNMSWSRETTNTVNVGATKLQGIKGWNGASSVAHNLL